MKDINFSDTVQFGIWKYLDEVNGVVVPQYSCAQPITNGVRLGNGNDTIAGVGECGVTPPLISCDGATSSMSFSAIAGVWSIYVDDFETSVATGNIGPALSQVLTAYSGKLTGSYDGVMYIQVTDNSNHRIKLEPVSGTSFTANSEYNPTFLEHEDGSLTFCLSPPIWISFPSM